MVLNDFFFSKSRGLRDIINFKNLYFDNWLFIFKSESFFLNLFIFILFIFFTSFFIFFISLILIFRTWSGPWPWLWFRSRSISNYICLPFWIFFSFIRSSLLTSFVISCFIIPYLSTSISALAPTSAWSFSPTFCVITSVTRTRFANKFFTIIIIFVIRIFIIIIIRIIS